MIDRLICIAAATSLMGAGACSKIPWVGPLFDTKPVQHVEETVIEDTAEAAAEVCGEDVHVEVDIDPVNDPHCMHCPFHCPVAPAAVPATVRAVTYENSDATWDDLFPPKDDTLDNERSV